MTDTGTPLSLALVANGATGWTDLVDGNFTIINNAVATINTALATIAATAGAAGPQGPVGMVFTGAWNSSTAYTTANSTTGTPACVVTFNGSAYIAVANNANAQPDINTNIWNLLAAAGLPGVKGDTGDQGLQGLQGIQGPPGGDATIVYPIAVNQGGTGSTTPAGARANLLAAMLGINTDILSLLGITCDGIAGGRAGISIVSPGGAGPALLFTNGTDSGGITSDGVAYLKAIFMSGGILCGGLQVSGSAALGEINSPLGGTNPVSVASPLLALDGLTLQGSAPAAPAANQISLGADIASSATAGTAGALPAQVAGYWKGLANIGGSVVAIRIPFCLA